MTTVKATIAKKQYVNSTELYNEIIKSKEQNKLTKRAVELLMLMTEQISKTCFQYQVPEDRNDCKQSGLVDVVKYWRGFNPEKSNNAFAYFTQVIKCGMAKGWKSISARLKATQKVSLGSDSYNSQR